MTQQAARLFATILILVSVAACSHPTDNQGLDGEYTLVGTERGDALPNQVKFYPTSYTGSSPAFDTLGYVTQGSLHVAGSGFTATLQFRRGANMSGPLETVTCSGKLRAEVREYPGPGTSPLSGSTVTVTVLVFSQLSGEFLGHPLGSWGRNDSDGVLSDDYRQVFIEYGNVTELHFARD